MVVTLFDQDYIIKAHELEMKKEAEIKATIETCQEDGCSYEKIVERIVKKYKLYPDEAEEYMEDYWHKEN